jgi:hypothetical protein
MKPDFSKMKWRLTVMWVLLAAFVAIGFGQVAMSLCFLAAYFCLAIAMMRHGWIELEARYKREDKIHMESCERIKNLLARSAMARGGLTT